MSASITVYEVVPNIEYVGNEVMDLYKRFSNLPDGLSIDAETDKKYGLTKSDDYCDEWYKAYKDFSNTAYIYSDTKEFVRKADMEDNTDEFGFQELYFIDLTLYEDETMADKFVAEQLNKLREAGIVKKHIIKTPGMNDSVYEYIPVKVARVENEPVYRQGWFFKSAWLRSDTALIFCTTLEDLKESLDKVIDTNSGYQDEDEKGREAYEFILNSFNNLLRQNPDKRYFVKIAF